MTTPGGSVGPSPIRKDPVVQAPPGRQNSVATLFVDAIAQVFTSLARLTVLALFVITFLLQPSQIPSSSMEPTMLVGDFVLVNKQVFAPAGHWGWLLPYRDPRRDDIVVFHYPVDPTELLVKRVIAVPGDRLHLHRGAVVLNGSSLVEPFTRYDLVEPSPFRDEFPTLERADPAVEAPWWIELRRRMRRGELPVPPQTLLCHGRQPQQQPGQPLLGLCAAHKHRRRAITGLPVRGQDRKPSTRTPARRPQPACCAVRWTASGRATLLSRQDESLQK